MRFLFIILALFCSMLPLRHGRSAALLERGTAITDPLSLRELDRRRFGLGQILARMRSDVGPLANDRLFALPSMVPLRKALDDEFERYVAGKKRDRPGDSIGIGSVYDLQLFDRALLYSPHSRFMLAGIVNRMDRAYLSESGCGEIRLIYRLTRTGPAATGVAASPRRLPMTLNVVLKARGDDAAGHGDPAITCAEIARRWLATAESALAGAELADALLSDEGPLNTIDPGNIERVETNLQIAHRPKSATHDFRTEYLLKVFRYNAQQGLFEEAPLENQIDRGRILSDGNLKRDFRAWLLDVSHFSELDRGTILIPDRFLATAAIAATPAGFAPSGLQPAYGLVQGDGATGDPVFTETDLIGALQRVAERGVELLNIRSVAGFERRLNDVTCAGCHQTRGIGGFHFPGADWTAVNPSNSNVVPGSPHFFGDQVRRRDILMSLRDRRRPDYSRGFSSRPQSRGSSELAGTEYADGWGGHCYRQEPGADDNDPSFRAWTCARGLACQVVGGASRMGMCFVAGRQSSRSD